jgi:quinol monooxygenase YgiN
MMVIALGDVYVRIADREQVREAMRVAQVDVQGEPGCRRYDFAEVVEDPGHFVIVQEWDDHAALERHYRSQAFAAYQAAVAEHLVRTSDLVIREAGPGLGPVDHSAIEPAQED